MDENKFWKYFFYNESMSKSEKEKSFKKFIEKFHDKNEFN